MFYGLDGELPAEARRVARECLDDALERLDRLGAATSGPATDTDLHEVRKRCKELRGLARLLRSELGADYEPFNAAVRSAAGELAPIRDAAAARTALERLKQSSRPKQARRLDAVRDAQGQAAAEADLPRHELGERLGAAAESLRDARAQVDFWFLGGAGDHDWSGALEHGVRRTYRKGRKALARVRRSEDDGDALVHEWRKSVKYLMYESRLVTPSGGHRVEELASALDDLSELLGDHHDLAVLAGRIEARERAGAVPRKVARHALKRVRRRQRKLRARAVELGREIFDDRPSVFGRRVAPRFSRERDGRYARDDQAHGR